MNQRSYLMVANFNEGGIIMKISDFWDLGDFPQSEGQ